MADLLDVGPGGALTLSVLLSLSRTLGLKKACDAVRKSLNDSHNKIDVSRATSATQDDQLLLAVHDFILNTRVKRSEKSPRPWDDDTFLPESALRAAPYAPALTELLIRSVANTNLAEKRRVLLDAAVTFLDPRGMDRFAAAWETSCREQTLSIEALRDVVDTLIARRCAPAPLLRMLLEKSTDETWERAVALLYHLSGEAGRVAARELTALQPPPQPGAELKRRHFSEPHQGTIWAAWKSRDAEFLALACERSLISFYTKNAQPIVPEAPAVFHRSNYSNAPAQHGVPLAELWQFVRHSLPQRVPNILKAALRDAEAAEFPRVLLEMESGMKDSPLKELAFEGGVLELLGLSQVAVVHTGLTILAQLPAVASKRTADAINLTVQALTSSETAAARMACSALVALAETFSAQRQEILEKLSFALALDNPVVLQQVIRSIKQVRGSGKAALGLNKATAQRLRELSDDNPAKFQKLVQPLLKGVEK